MSTVLDLVDLVSYFLTEGGFVFSWTGLVSFLEDGLSFLTFSFEIDLIYSFEIDFLPAYYYFKPITVS